MIFIKHLLTMIQNKRRRLDSNPLVPHKFTQQMASVTKPIIEEYNLEPKEVQDTFIDSEVGGQTSVEENIASEPSSPNPKGDQVSKEVDNIYSSDNFDLPEQAHENEVDVSQRGNHGEDQVVTPPANRLPTLNHSADGSESQSRVPLHDIQPGKQALF